MALPFSTLITSDGLESIERRLGGQAAMLLDRKDLLTLQFTKLVNYFPEDLDEEWGARFFAQGDYRELQRSLARFLEKAKADHPRLPLWIERRYEELPWGGNNFRLTDEPPSCFGDPYDPYLSCNGGILPIQQASRILRLDTAELIRVKLRLLVDEAVIAESIGRMLKPGSWVWPPKPTI